jgi:hypothetical protein
MTMRATGQCPHRPFLNQGSYEKLTTRLAGHCDGAAVQTISWFESQILRLLFPGHLPAGNMEAPQVPASAPDRQHGGLYCHTSCGAGDGHLQFCLVRALATHTGLERMPGFGRSSRASSIGHGAVAELRQNHRAGTAGRRPVPATWQLAPLTQAGREGHGGRLRDMKRVSLTQRHGAAIPPSTRS